MAAAGRMAAALRASTGAERARIAAMLATIALVNALGWSIFAFTILPHHFRYDGLGVGIGVAVTAWTLGLRHAFDADHIAAIDNTTRKLMHEGRRPLSTGFWFSLGHSTIVFALSFLLALGLRSLAGPVRD